MATSLSEGGSYEQGMSYYPEQNKKESYYVKKSELGYLHGKGIVELGLKEGQVLDLKTFKALLKGHNPTTGKALVKNAGVDRERAYYDVTNSPPKSLSIVIAQLESRGENERALALRNLHEKASQTAIKRIQENFTLTRISTGKNDPKTKKAITKKIKTNGLMYATFQHDVAREVEGKIDPQLHDHNVIFNQVTYTDKHGKIKTTSLHNDEIFKNRVSIELEYNTQLATLLRENGIEVELTHVSRGEFEIVGFEREQIMEFSSRRALIERELPKYRERYPQMPEGDLKDLIVKETKKAKQEIDMEKLLEVNAKRMEKVGIDNNFIDGILKDFGEKNLTLVEGINKEKTIRNHIEVALKNITQKESTFNIEAVMRQAMQQSALHGFGFKREDYEPVFNEMVLGDVDENNPMQLVEIGEKDLESVYSTREIIEAEQVIFKATQQSLKENQKTPFIANEEEINNFIKRENEKQGFDLTKGQTDLVRTILNSDNRFLAVQGVAGAGKTASISQIVTILKEKRPDLEVLGLSFMGNAVKEMQAESGIEAKTLHSHLFSEKNAREKGKPTGKPKLYIVDESGMAGSVQIAELVKYANEEGSMVAFVGDVNQYKSISAGQIHDDIQVYGMKTVVLDEGLRQKTKSSKAIVDALMSRDFDKFIEVLEKEDRLNTGTVSEMMKDIISAYRIDKELYSKRTQIMTSLNEHRRIINLMVREVEKEKGVQIHLSKKEMTQTSNYEEGMILKTKESGQQFRVMRIKNENTLVVKNIKSDKTKELELDLIKESHKFQIFNKKDGVLEKEDYKMETLETVNLQNIEAQYAENYEKGMLITINTAIKGINGGSKAVVVGAKKGYTNVIIVERKKDKKIIEINLSDIKLDNIGVYRKVEKNFSVGEPILYGKNDKKNLGVVNGMDDRITAIDAEGNIETERGKKFNIEDYPYIDQSSCRTTNSMQGGTVDRSLSLIDVRTTTTNSILVDVTRNKFGARLWVTDKDKFRKKIEDMQWSDTTLGYVNDKDVKELLNKTNQQKGKENGKDITRENGSNTPRANGQDARDQENGYRELEPVNNTQEREHSVSGGSATDLSNIDGRGARGQSTSRVARGVIKSRRDLINTINETILRLDALIKQADKFIAKKIAKAEAQTIKITSLPEEKATEIALSKLPKEFNFKRATNEELKENVMKRVKELSKDKPVSKEDKIVTDAKERNAKSREKNKEKVREQEGQGIDM